MAFPAHLRSFGEMSSGHLDLLVFSLFPFSCADWFVSRTNDGPGMRPNVVLSSTGACCVDIGSELIKFSPTAVKYITEI